MRKRGLLIGALFLWFVVFPTASALAYSQVVAFGDSLSDNGPADGWGIGVASNGPVWLDYLAQDLGIELLDMAFGGARTYGHPNVGDSLYEGGLTWQVDQYLNGYQVDPDALYTVWIGGNDLLSTLPPESNRPFPTTLNAVANIGYVIGELYEAGARDIVLMNMPNLGATPYLNGENVYLNAYNLPGLPELYDLPGYGEALARGFNCSLAITQAIMEWYLPNLNFYSVDMFALMNEFIAGDDFYNTENMLLVDQLLNPGVEIDQRYLFWDAIHPTTYAHSLIADAVYAQVAPVPEPSTIVLMGLGLVGLAGMGRKKFRKR